MLIQCYTHKYIVSIRHTDHRTSQLCQLHLRLPRSLVIIPPLLTLNPTKCERESEAKTTTDVLQTLDPDHISPLTIPKVTNNKSQRYNIRSLFVGTKMTKNQGLGTYHKILIQKSLRMNQNKFSKLNSNHSKGPEHIQDNICSINRIKSHF